MNALPFNARTLSELDEFEVKLVRPPYTSVRIVFIVATSEEEALAKAAAENPGWHIDSIYKTF